jgi:predicted outer membrane repeat protein
MSLAVLATCLAAGGAYGATLTVAPSAIDQAIDTDGQCSLREAVMSVNAQANVGPCVADLTQTWGTQDTIKLPAGTYTLTLSGLDENFLDSDPSGTLTPLVVNVGDATVGDLDISRSVRIEGAGASSTLVQWSSADGVTRDRIFHVNADAGTVAVSLVGMTLSGGQTLEQVIKTGPVSGSGDLSTTYYLRRAGGAIAVGPAAAVVLVDPNVSGQANAAGRGGSKKPGTTEETGATLSISLSGVVVSGNSAQGDGAGIYTAAAMTASDLVVSNNTSTTNGGGVYNEGNTSVSNATFSGNTAEGGGGFFGTGSNTVNFTGVTFSGNEAVGGGAISGRAGVAMKLINSTLSGNIGTDVGGGLYTNGAADLRFVTIANNLAGADSSSAGAGINTFPSSNTNLVTLKNVLLADNRKGYTVDPALTPEQIAALPSANCGSTSSSSSIVSQGHNLSSDTSCQTVLSGSGDLNNQVAQLGVLANNGGNAQTHALLANSPALGAGIADPEVLVDQRGTLRDAVPDIGAYELPAPVVTSTTEDPTATSSSGGGCTVNPNAGFDPGLPTVLMGALALLLGRRRRKGTQPKESDRQG